MILERFREEKGSAIGMYIRSFYMPPEDMRSIVDIPKLSEIASTCGIFRR